MNTYTRLGSLENVFFPNGTRTVYQYDVMNHLTNEVNYNGASQLLAQYQYTAASDGTRLASTETRRESDGTYSTTAITWSNDALHRLVREASSSTLPALNFTNCYVYDLAGNRLWKTNSSGAGTQVTAYTYNANDQLLIESTSSVSFTNSYDANGSVTNRSSASEQNIYSYNLEGRLAGALVKRTESGQAIQQTNRYYYNQSGIRVRAEMTGSVNATNLFLNDPQNLSGFSQALEELPAMGAIPTTTYTIGNQVMAQEKSGTVSFLMPDGHGSTRLLTDASGTISDRYSYDAYGNGLDFTATTLNPPTTRLLYSGEQFDPDLQQYYLRARYYNPTAGRFGAQDQLNGTPDDPLSLHKYAYCQNNPVNGRDPSGNDDLESLSFTMSIGASLENEYYRALAKEGYIAATKVNEIGQSYNSTVDAASRDASPGVDTATIIVHGVEGVDTHGGHSSGWSKNFQQNLGPQPILNVGGKPLNHDFYEFDWGGFGILPGYGFYPIKSVHEMALVQLQMEEMLVSMNGYANIDIISHSWGTCLSYDLLNNSSIEVHDWVTMGSPLKRDTRKPVENTGNWFNYYSKKDPVTQYEIYPPFPSFGEMLDAVRKNIHGGPGLSADPNIQPSNEREHYMGSFSVFEHTAYWDNPWVLTHLRGDLQ